MRDALTIRLGGKEYPLLPTFGVLSDFEDRFGSIAAHYAALSDLTARLTARSYLVFLALRAARDEHPGDGRSLGFTQEATAKALFERGLWHEDTVSIEIELVERLLYTPEQFQQKKAARAEAKRAQEQAMQGLNMLSSFAESPLQT